MSERYYMTGAQIGEMTSSIEHGDIKAVIGTLRKIADDQFIGNMHEPTKQEIAIVPKLRTEPDVRG